MSLLIQTTVPTKSSNYLYIAVGCNHGIRQCKSLFVHAQPAGNRFQAQLWTMKLTKHTPTQRAGGGIKAGVVRTNNLKTQSQATQVPCRVADVQLAFRIVQATLPGQFPAPLPKSFTRAASCCCGRVDSTCCAQLLNNAAAAPRLLFLRQLA